MTQKQRNVSTNGFVYSDGIMDENINDIFIQVKKT